MTTSPSPAAQVSVFALGGTISIAPGAMLTGQQLLDAVPGLDRAGARTEVHEFRQLPSASLTSATSPSWPPRSGSGSRPGWPGPW